MRALVHRVKDRLSPLWWYSALMFAASRVGDVVGLYIAMFLVPDYIGKDKLGAVLPLWNLGLLAALPLTVVSRTAMKYVSMFLVQRESGYIKALLRDLAVVYSVVSAVIVLVLWRGWGFIDRRLDVGDSRIALVLGAMIILSCWRPLVQSIAQGLKHFYRIILARMMGPIARLVVTVLLIRQLQLVGYLSGMAAMALASSLILCGGALYYLRSGIEPRNYRAMLPEMVRYGVLIAVMVFTTTLQKTVEPWIIRHWLPTEDSAGYYIAAMFGRIPLYVAPAMMPFLFPLVSERFERGESTHSMYRQAIGLAAGLGAGIVILLAFGGETILGLRATWAEYNAYAPCMWKIALVSTCDVLLGCHMMHESASREFRYLRYLLPIAVIEVGVLYVLMGWGALEGILPPGFWQDVSAAYTPSLAFVINFMLASRLIMVSSVFLDTHRRVTTTLSRG